MAKISKQGQTKQSPAFLHPQQLVTGQDLEDFRQKLVNELEQVLKQHLAVPRKWLKSYEVRKLLNISPGTLQHLKAKGTIPYSKMGGAHYYDWTAIEEFLRAGNRPG